MIDQAAKQKGRWALRDVAIVRLLWDLGLRRTELSKIDVTDIDFRDGSIWILGKCRLQKEKMTLPTESLKAIKAWLGDRRTGPLFTKMNGKRLRDSGIYGIIVKLGKCCGLKVWPHGIRHAAITDVLDATNGNMRIAQKFSRHKSMDILGRYDDNREDLGGRAAQLISDRLTGMDSSTVSPP